MDLSRISTADMLCELRQREIDHAAMPDVLAPEVRAEFRRAGAEGREPDLRRWDHDLGPTLTATQHLRQVALYLGAARRQVLEVSRRAGSDWYVGAWFLLECAAGHWEERQRIAREGGAS